MAPKTYLRISLALSSAGALFAGYLSAIKLFTGTCAFNEPCPYFLGYPACWYGFGMFLTMFLVSLAAVLGKTAEAKATRALAGVSAVGVVFAGYFVVGEVIGWLAVGRFRGYGLALPTCIYGLIFYVIIFSLSAPRLRRSGPKA